MSATDIDRIRRGELHLFGDAASASIECPSEDPGKGKDIVYLIGEVAASGRDDRSMFPRFIGVDLRVWV